MKKFRMPGLGDTTKREVRSEIAFHLEMRAKEFMEQGMSPDEARRAAAAAFGDVGAITTQVRSLREGDDRRQRWHDSLRGLGMDIAFAVRTLRKNPGFTAAAVATLTLGIGALTAVFTVVNGVLLRPLPYAHPESIAMVWLADSAEPGDQPLSAGFYNDLRADSGAFAGIAAFRSWPYTIAGDGPAEQVAGARVSPSLFRVLGVSPELGAAFSDADAVPGGPNVALISWSYWQRRFAGAASVVGSSVVMSGQPYTIVGVMPRGFAFPRGAELMGGLQFGARTDIWTPLVFEPGTERNYGTQNMAGVARLKPGMTAAAAAGEASAGLHRWLAQNAPNAKLDYHVVSLKQQAGAPVQRSLLILMGAVVCVLLIACANVTNLLVARTTARQREFAVRAALGAGRGRIARQLVTENVLLALAGTALGLGLSVLAVKAMLALVPGSLPRVDDVTVDLRVIALALAAALAAGTAFGLATAWQVRRAELASRLQAAAGRATGGIGRRIGRRVLVAVEISLSLTLLVGAGELTLSFLRLQRIDTGFVADHALAADVQLPLVNGFNPDRDEPGWQAFFAQLMERLNAAPGVVAAGGVSALPLSNRGEWSSVAIAGQAPPPPGTRLRVQYNIAAGKYFEAAGIKVVEGRAFDARDDRTGAPVAIVNREFARQYLKDVPAIGAQVTGNFEFRAPPLRTIVGVVDDVRPGHVDDEAVPQIYVSQGQIGYPSLSVVMRTRGEPGTALAPLRTAVKALDGSAAVAHVRTLEDLANESLARQRFSATIILSFAAAALALAMVGLYGVIALYVGQRRKEIGVRMALGARGADVLRLLLGEGMMITGAGIAIGIVGALAAGRALNALLYGSAAGNVVVYVVAAAGVGLLSLAATWLPARRATRVDPTVALRSE